MSDEREASEEEESDQDGDGETVEDAMCRFSNGVTLLNYVQFLNLLGDENFTEK